MIERLLPSTVAVAETRVDSLEIELFPEEVQSLGRAVDKRRREFTTGRACARTALSELGVEPIAIPSGARGEPLWPPGIVGSITHCRGYCGCAVARADRVLSVGIDAETNLPLPDGVLEQVAFGPERELAGVTAQSPSTSTRRDDVCLDRLLFSAKESVYKAWFPLTGAWLEFEDVELSIDVPNATFVARLLVPGPAVDGTILKEFRGRWCAENGLLCTSVILTPITVPGEDGRP